MRIIDLLFRRVESRPLPEPHGPVVLPPEDEEQEEEGGLLGYAEGQTFMIEYRDAKGALSRRRITVIDIRRGTSGVPCLVARCHERKAMRMFRVDRIASCIDYDGQVFDDVPAFLQEMLGMAPQAARAREAAGSRWPRVREIIAPDAVLLSAMCAADGTISAAEAEQATVYLARVAERALADMLSPDEIGSVETYLRRLRPGYDAIARAIDRLRGRGRDDILALLRAAVSIMDADGRRHPEEIALVNTIAEELTGVTVV